MKLLEQRVRQDKSGKDYKSFKLDNGKWMSIFQFDSRYNEMQVGMELDDSLLIYDQTYDNYKLKPVEGGVKIKTPGGYKSVQINQAMDKKDEMIKGAQERKNDAIAQAGAFRDATLVTLASLKDVPFPTPDEFKEEWRSWVKFFLNEGDQPFV